MRLLRSIIVIPLAVLTMRAQEPVHQNRLAKETSPYLLQHKNNPVDWYPWGPEALARAKQEDKVIFLSIGYSACHWCHVMEHESFENSAIAKLMNETFINIKVDREERPDLDEIYMAAVVGLTGRGGWPMSVFLTPDLQPFFGGTYYPPEASRGMPGFRQIIEHIETLWRDRRDEVITHSGKIAAYLQEQLAPKAVAGDLSLDFVDAAAAQSAQRYDEEHGGFGQPPQFAPKFPHTAELQMLLRYHARTGDDVTLDLVENTLQKMAFGGIYDQLGGGFHRYSTDRVWLVPHFEKMLYDNALLVRVYAEAYQVTGKELYARIVSETLDYLLREMQDAAGGFYSTQNADSEGVEGKFFVWQKREIDAVAGADAAAACLHWGVTEHGNWEHDNVLHLAKSIAACAVELKQSEAEVAAAVQRARAVLLAHRAQRIAPTTDDKVLCAWNGMAIAAFATGYQVLGEPRYLDAARRAADFALTSMRVDGRLLRTSRHGEAKLMGYLEDYGYLADGLLCLFESDFDPRWLREAKSLLEVMRDHFRDASDGGFFFTADDHEKMITRNKTVSESSIPSGQAMAVLAFLRGGLLLGDSEFEQIGIDALRSNHGVLSTQPISCASLVLGLQLHLSDPREVVLVGELSDSAVLGFLRAVRGGFPPHHVLTLLHSGNRAELVALAPVYAGKTAIDGKPTAYVCRHGVCEAPVTDPVGFVVR